MYIMYILYIAPTKNKGLPILYAAASILPFQALPILSMYVKIWVSLHSSY